MRCDRVRGNEHSGVQGVLFEHQERLYCMGYGALAEAIRSLWNLLGDLQKLSGHGPGHLALGCPAGSRDELEGLRGSFQPPSFCGPDSYLSQCLNIELFLKQFEN